MKRLVVVYVKVDNKTLNKIKKDYMDGMTYRKIEKKYKISYNQLIYFIQSNKWKRRSNRSEVQKGNQNAKGNKGGHAPKFNKNAVSTGEYESIFSNFYTEEEKNIAKKLREQDEVKKLEHDIEVYTIREARMLQRIAKLNDSGKDMTIQSMNRHKSCSSEIGGYTNESTSTYAEPTVDKIQKIEEALTRVQQSRVKATDAIQKIKLEKEKHELQKKYYSIKFAQEEDELEDTSEMDEVIYGKNN